MKCDFVMSNKILFLCIFISISKKTEEEYIEKFRKFISPFSSDSQTAA